MQSLTGLVVCGGRSSRMGTDKGLIAWHGIAQRLFLYRMLEPLCKKVFISCNAGQADSIESGYDHIADDKKYCDIGPMAALLSAFNKYPGDSFLIVGCDYPFIKEEDIIQLINNRNENDNAISFFNEVTGFYEPLLAIYENKISDLLFHDFYLRQFSLQNILRRTGARKVNPIDMQHFKSIDTPGDQLTAVEQLKSRK